jgi:hypothetical protein
MDSGLVPRAEAPVRLDGNLFDGVDCSSRCIPGILIAIRSGAVRLWQHCLLLFANWPHLGAFDNDSYRSPAISEVGKVLGASP